MSGGRGHYKRVGVPRGYYQTATAQARTTLLMYHKRHGIRLKATAQELGITYQSLRNWIYRYRNRDHYRSRKLTGFGIYGKRLKVQYGWC